MNRFDREASPGNKAKAIAMAQGEVDYLLSPNSKWTIKKKMGSNLIAAAQNYGDIGPIITLLESNNLEAQKVAVSSLHLAGPECWEKVGDSLDLVLNHPDSIVRAFASEILKAIKQLRGQTEI